MKAKTSKPLVGKRQSNTKKNIKSKKIQTKPEIKPWEDYLCSLSFKMKPVNDVWLSAFALEWTEHARLNPDYINIWNFPVLIRGIANNTINGWAERNSDVAHAIRYVRLMCSIRRDEGAAKKDFDGSWIAKTMPLYCNDYKDLEQWRANLSEKIAAAGGVKIVEMESFSAYDAIKKTKK